MFPVLCIFLDQPRFTSWTNLPICIQKMQTQNAPNLFPYHNLIIPRFRFLCSPGTTLIHNLKKVGDA